MTKLFLTAAATALLVTSGMAFADSDNWDKEKAGEVMINRNTNSGLGNGGEKPYGTAFKQEVQRGDYDPGNSGAQCQGGKNEPTYGSPCD